MGDVGKQAPGPTGVSPAGAGGATGAVAGKRSLTSGMSQRTRYLRELAEDTAVPLEVWIPTTVEFQHYRRPDLVWQWGAKVNADEALLACKLIVLAMRGGQRVDWQLEARSYLNQARAQLGKKGEPEATASADASSAATPAGSVTPIEDPGAEGEVEGPEPTQGDVGGQVENDETHDPGIPGNLGDLVEQAKRLAELLEKQGDSDKSSRVRFLADGIASGLVSLGIVAGVYLVAVEYAKGKVIVVWTPIALESPDFLRRAARVDRIVAQLNANLSELDKIKAETGPEWVDELAEMSPRASDYQAGAEGARSNVTTGSPQAPVVEGVRFDGVDGDVLIDRKVSVHLGEKTKLQAMRQSQALAKANLRAVWEVPNEAQARRVEKLMSDLGITNITARIAP
jgi:hypothetical protein